MVGRVQEHVHLREGEAPAEPQFSYRRNVATVARRWDGQQRDTTKEGEGSRKGEAPAEPGTVAKWPFNHALASVATLRASLGGEFS